MKTVTLFFDYDHPIRNGCIAYLASHTYSVEDDIAAAIAERGVGEIVPDDILTDPPISDDDIEFGALKPIRGKNRRSAWTR